MIYYFSLAFIIFLALLLKSKKSLKNDKYFLIISFCVLCLISCLRKYTVGVDTLQYYTAFKKIANLSYNELQILRYEIGFTYLCKILSSLKYGPQSLIIITSIFINISVYNFIKKNSKNVYLSTILYIIFNFFFAYMNIMRQAIAISIILYAYEFLKKNKKISFIIFVIIASQFHESAYLALSLLFINRIKYNKKTVFLIIITTFFCFTFGQNIFGHIASHSSRLNEYTGSKFYSENYFGALIEFSIYFITYIFGIICINNTKIHTNNQITTNNEFITKVVGMAVILSAMVMRVSIFNRFLPYYSIFIIIWIPNFLSCINAKDKSLCTALITSLFTIYWIIILNFRPEWYGVIPYTPFWK